MAITNNERVGRALEHLKIGLRPFVEHEMKAAYRAQLDALYATGRSWPEPLISINPHYERDVTVDRLADDGVLHPDTARIFRSRGEPLTLYRHQVQAVAHQIS